MNRSTNRFGRRSSSLFLFGLLWALVGFGILSGGPDRFSRPGPGGNLEFMDHPHWGWMWITFGVTAILASLLRTRVAFLDEWGFNALLIPAWAWTLTFTWSAVTYAATAGEYGQGRAWVGAVVYLVISLAILVIAGWPEPPELVVEEALREEGPDV